MPRVSDAVFAQSDGLANLMPEEKELLENVVRLVEQRIAPAAELHDAAGEFPQENIARLNGLGLNAMFVPEEYGGAPLSFAAYLMCLREISRGCASTGLTWATNFHATHPLIRYAGSDLKSRLLPRIAEGALAAIAITEVTGGSDATAMRTVFKPAGDDIEVEGEKIYITNGDVASLILLFGKWEDPDGGRDALAVVAVDTSETPVKVRRRESKLGHRASSTVSLGFEEAAVPKGNLVAGPGVGYEMLVNSLGLSRISVAAHSLGIARAALDDILTIGNQNRVGGQILLEFQTNQVTLAEITGELLLCEAMMWQLAQPGQENQPSFAMLASLIKLRAADASVRAADFALQLCGGGGYCREYRAERLWRDARLAPVGEGARELLATTIGKQIARSASDAHYTTAFA